jgi:hypothetical protein
VVTEYSSPLLAVRKLATVAPLLENGTAYDERAKVHRPDNVLQSVNMVLKQLKVV